MLLLNRNRIKKNLSLEGNSSGKLKKSGSNSSQLMSEWSIKQGARQRRPRYREIMILDHIQDMKTLQGRGWLIIFLYLSYQFKISSELEILWDRLLEVCVAVYTRILWELWVDMFTYSSNEHLVFYGMKGHKFSIVHIARVSQPCNYQQELGFLFNVRTTQEGMRDMRYERDKKGKVEAEEHSNDICWSQITRHCQTIWWIIPQYSSRVQTQGCGLWGWRELNARRNQQN